MIKRKNVIGSRPYFYKIDEIKGFDIDTLNDFKYAEMLHKKLF